MRALGLDVTPTQIIDLVDGLKHIDLGQREDFKNTAQTILVNRREHLPLFDRAFDLFWQARAENELARLDLSTLLQKQTQVITSAEYKQFQTEIDGLSRCISNFNSYKND